MKRSRLAVACLLPFILTMVSFADQAALEAQFKQLLENHILSMKGPYAATDLKFDASGKLVGTSEIGPFPLFGSIQVSKFALQDSSIEIDGQRVVLVLGAGKVTDYSPILGKQTVHISIAITPPIKDDDQIRAALGEVFSSESSKERFANYWKPAVDLTDPCKTIKKDHPDGVVGTLAYTNPVYGCVKSSVVTAPKGITTPPPMTGKKPMDGSAKVRIVIDENGFPAIIKAMTSSTPTYGAAALEAVSTWKYKPALKDGKPVPYMLDVELGTEFKADEDKD